MINKIEKAIQTVLKEYKGIPSTLSGGIDSGLLTALVRPQLAVTVSLPGGTIYDETKDAKKVAQHLGVKHLIIKPSDKRFEEDFVKAVKIIGKPTPHFNIFPLYAMFEKLHDLGIKELLIADGPDETLCGYTRHLIMYHFYGRAEVMEAFKFFQPVIRKITKNLPNPTETYSQIINKNIPKRNYDKSKSLLTNLCLFDIKYMRPDMDIMANKLAPHFGVKIHRPYEKLDNLFLSLDDKYKVDETGEYGKYILRQIASRYLPAEIAWRKHKVGGPVYPVNKIKKGWMKYGEFDKRLYMKWQEDILK